MGTVGYLLDTHTFLWSVSEDQKLSDNARIVIEDSKTHLFVSPVSAYEIMNKYRIGKLPGYVTIAENYLDILHQLDASELPISTRHTH